MGTHRWFYYYYADNAEGHAVIRIQHKRKPSGAKNGPRIWTLRELDKEGKWVMPCFPEITWGRLSQMFFIRKELVNE